MSEERGRGWAGTPLDAYYIDPHGIVEIVVEFDEGAEVLTPTITEQFGSYDLNEAARYLYFLSNHIISSREGSARWAGGEETAYTASR